MEPTSRPRPSPAVLSVGFVIVSQFVGFLSGCPAPSAPAGRTAANARKQGPGERRPPRTEMIYRRMWPGFERGFTHLIGVDLKRNDLYHIREGQKSGQKQRAWNIVLEVVSLDRGTLKESRTGRGSRKRERFRRKLLASALLPTGPWHAHRPPPIQLVVSPDGRWMVDRHYDHLILADKVGRRVRRLDVGLRASYDAVFGPKGEMVAWHGFSKKHQQYDLWVSDIDGEPQRIPTAPHGKDPIFSPDGRFLYVLTQTPQDHLQAPPQMKKRPKRCLYRVQVGGKWAAEPLLCVRSPREVRFVQDPAGETGVFVQEQKNAYGSSSLAMTWLDLPSGRVRKKHRIPTGYVSRFRGVVDENGMMAFTPYHHLLVAMDLESGKKGLLLSAQVHHGRIRLGGTRFLGDGRIPVLRAMRKPKASTEVWLASPLDALSSRPASDMPPFCHPYGKRGKENDDPKKPPKADAASSAADGALSSIDVYSLLETSDVNRILKRSYPLEKERARPKSELVYFKSTETGKDLLKLIAWKGPSASLEKKFCKSSQLLWPFSLSNNRVGDVLVFTHRPPMLALYVLDRKRGVMAHLLCDETLCGSEQNLVAIAKLILGRVDGP
jgi:hypothetical protein